MKSSVLIATACALSVALFSGCRWSPEEKAVSLVSRKLDLNETQKAEFKKLAALAVDDMKSMRGDREAMANEVEKQVVNEKADTTEIKRLVTAQSTKRQEMTVKWIDRLAQFQSTLSPEQKLKAQEALRDLRKKMSSNWD